MPKQRKPNGERKTRVRSKRLDQLDESKLALAFWLLAKQIVAGDDEDRHNQSQPKPGPR